MLLFLNAINPTNLTNLSDLTSEFRETSISKKFRSPNQIRSNTRAGRDKKNPEWRYWYSSLSQ